MYGSFKTIKTDSIIFSLSRISNSTSLILVSYTFAVYGLSVKFFIEFYEKCDLITIVAVSVKRINFIFFS